MIAYVIVGVIAVLAPVIGYFLGAVRMFTCFVGVFVGVFTAPMISAQIKGLLPKIKITDPFWQDFFGPGISFFIVLLVFFGISFAVHMVPSNYYRMRRDEVTRLKWNKVMQKAGVVMGLVTGLAVLIATSHLVSTFGYPAKLFPGSSQPKGFSSLTETQDGFDKVGLSQISGGLNKTPDEFYDLVETVATIYNNPSPAIKKRLTAYPPFLNKLKDDSFYKSIASDSSLKDVFSKKGDFTKIYSNQNVQNALKDMPIYQELEEIDLNDMKEFLKTGKSKKYSKNKVVGRWKLDSGQTTRECLSEMGTVSKSILPVVRKAFKDVDIVMTATLDGKFTSSITIPQTQIARYLSEQASQQRDRVKRNASDVRIIQRGNPDGDSFGGGGGQDFGDSYNPPPRMSQDMIDDYGLSGGAGGRGGGAASNSEAFQSNQAAQQELMRQRMRNNKSSDKVDPAGEIQRILAELGRNTSGTWEKQGYKYVLKFGNGRSLDGLVVDDELKIVDNMKKYVFYPDI